MEVKGGGVSVDGGVLGNVGVVDHAVLAIGNESMDFYIVVGGEPLVENILAVGSPENGAVQHAAVFEGVGEAGNVDAAAVAEAVYGHLHFLVLLDQNIGALIGVDALLALAEVYFTGDIFQNEVATLFFPVVLVVVQGKAGFLLNAQQGSQLQIVALILVTGGFTNTDEAAAVMDKLADCCGNCGIFPLGATGVGGVTVTDVDDYINIVQNGCIIANIVEGDELHIEGGAGQSFDDTGSRTSG